MFTTLLRWHISQIEPTDMTALEAVLAVDSVREQLEKDGFRVELVDQSRGSVARLYEPQIQDILSRLVNNAVKFHGTEKTIEINVNDGLTGFPPGVSSRGIRTKHTQVKVKEETRKDGKKRKVVVDPKDTPVAAEDWK